MNYSHVVATKLAGSFYVDSQTLHHVSYRNGFFDAVLHGAELGTVGWRSNVSLSHQEAKRWRPAKEGNQARDGSSSYLIVSVITVDSNPDRI